MRLTHAHAWPLILLMGGGLVSRADRVDEFLQAEMQKRRIPGLVLAVVQEGRTAKCQGYGFANLEWRTPVAEDTVFEIGSITKQFTAALVLMLVEEGKLGLDDRLGRQLAGLPETWTNITVRHLLTHTSGLKNYNNLPGFEVSRRLTAARFIKALGAQPLESEPGERFAYCNSGYNLLGYLLEQISGERYWDLLARRIFKPLEMTSGRSRDLRAVIPKRAAGYELETEGWSHRDADLTDVFAAGAILSTVTDLVKWNAALDARRLLRPASYQQMWTPVTLKSGRTYPYGFGWRLADYKGRKCIGHSGSTAGFSASLLRFPDDRLAVILLCNLGEQGAATALARGVAELCLESPSAETK